VKFWEPVKFWSSWTVDQVIVRLVAFAVLAEVAINYVTSYQHIYYLALKFGQHGTDAHLTPVDIDLALLVFAMVSLYLARKGRRALISYVNRKGKVRYRLGPAFGPRFAVILGVGGTVAANAAYGYWWGDTGAVLSSAPAVLLAMTIEAGVLLLRVAAEEAQREREETEARRAEEEAERAARQEKNSERGKRAAETRKARKGDPGDVQDVASPELPEDPFPTVKVPALTGIGLNGGPTR
jgi:hypothetical protein